ncbi:MAG: hypothetical protein ACFE85_01920 [Candidatus Hodarchaeota archaeon]
MKSKNKYLISEVIIVYLIFTLTFGFYAIPIKVESLSRDFIPKSSQFVPRNIRIAIYDEPNVTVPSYGEPVLTYNYNNIEYILTTAGYTVSNLTTTQILNHELTTAKFDVFVLVDNLPRESIVNYVKEFWLGGGAILSFDSAISYLCYAGILPPESEGDNGYFLYWDYLVSATQNVTLRHPISKSYALGENFTNFNSDFATFFWSALMGTSISSDLYKIATINGNDNAATVVAYEPTIFSGGKVVHILTNFQLDADDLVVDAVEWLCPRPKGRILFDLSHLPYYGIDPWDTLADYYPRFEIIRDYLVNRSYTIDKLYPSVSGNLTTANLAPYDVLVIALSNYNFTSSEVSVVTNWVNSGGNLLIFGENTILNTQNENVNYLLKNFDLKINLTSSGSGAATYQIEHPIHEGCSQLTVSAPGKVVYSGNAFPILGSDADNIFIAGQEYGDGRIILMSDIAPFRDSTIMSTDNLQYGINLLNWLTASQAEVLLYLDQTGPPDPNDNYYRAPVTNALNDLGVPFYLTYTIYYFNLSMSFNEYPLAIIDNPVAYIGGYFSDVLNYMKSGGHLIISTYSYGVTSGDPLWDYLGFEPTGDTFSTPQPIYIWDNTHPIFNTPADYGATSISSTYNYVITDVCNLTIYGNATAIAGLTSSASSEGVAVILGAEGRSIANAMLVTTYIDDTDDSTYPDAQELWENEIAYMMSIIYPPTEPDGFNWLWIIIIAAIIVGALAIIIIIIRKRKK